ncbi:serine/threonine-protein kinase [Micromonospora sp. WMMD882]|uniref:serine/threonine-protein kinase n=1 Tax=Micromonospora sp. WMMD882 TaxID=3015151 RepID=UPI00248C7802|nr:serine/threonine-protein kinase [Micromonospora sp. WMMD882]WBB80757.1 serine/threonine-protein kinase [Micromonospora sp. WMMD882]
MRCLHRRYRLDEPVGRGGMAVVWRGHDLRLQRTVAVKMLSSALLGDLAARQRMRAEALAVARVGHPHIASVFDYGEHRRLGRPAEPFLVMEFVDGDTLAARLADGGPLAWPETARLGAEVAAALAAAHAHGVVHRDVKPGNVMLTPTGVKVVDFGVAAGIGQDPADPNGIVWGTPAYLAPEQAAGLATTPAGDVFALGLTLVECLTGRRPDRAPHDPASVDLSACALPGPVAGLLERCLSTDPRRRPPAARLADALRAAPGTATAYVRPSAGVVAGPSATGGVPSGQEATRAVSPPTRPPVSSSLPPRPPASAAARRRRRIRRVGLLVGAPSVLLAALLASQVLPGMVGAGDAADGDPTAPDVGMCVTHYQARQNADGTFTARLTVNSPAWRDGTVRFALPSGQRLVDAVGAAWSQHQRLVTLDLPAGPESGSPVTATLHGRNDNASHDVPRTFVVDGELCAPATTRVRTQVMPSPATPTTDGPGTGPGPVRDGQVSAPPSAPPPSSGPPSSSAPPPAVDRPSPSPSPSPSTSVPSSPPPSSGMPSSAPPTTAPPTTASPTPAPTTPSAPPPTEAPEPTPSRTATASPPPDVTSD